MQESFGRRLWRLFYPLLTFTGISNFVSFVFIWIRLCIEILNNNISIFGAYEEMYNMIADISVRYVNEMNAITFICTIPVFILYMHMDKKRKIKAGIYKQEKKAVWYKYIILPFLGVASCVGGTFMIILGGWELNGMNNISDEMFMGKTVIEMISLGILYPIVFELLYTGLLYNRLKEYMTKSMAVLLISLLIAFNSASLTQGIYVFLMSVLSIYVYERYHSIITPIIVSCGAAVITVLEKELNILSGLYSSWGNFVTVTVVLCVLVIALILVIEKFVYVNNEETINNENM